MKKRSYNQNCNLAHALDIIGERWSFLMVRELLIGPRRFKDLLEGLAGIGTNLLTTRLKELEQTGLLEKTTLPPPAGSTVYQLTKLGKGLEPAILELIKWGLRFPDKSQTDYLSKPEWDIVALRALFHPERAQGFKGTYQFCIEGVAYHAIIENESAEIELGTLKHPDVILTTDRSTLGALGKGLEISEALHSGKLQLDGDWEAVKRIGDIFEIDSA